MARVPVQLVLALLALCLGSIATSAVAREAITSFSSEVTIQPDASLQVTETIVVTSEGDQIKRGIVREFPTTYRDKYGHRFNVAFDILSVKRNGRTEPFHTKRRSNGIDLYIGSSDTFLNRGEHRFDISYSTTRQIGYHDGFDELYWNVTGNGWRLPIDHVIYTLILPRHARALDIAAYTGAFGAAGKDYQVTNDTDGLVRVMSTRGFAEGEGLTVAVSFPTDLVYRPTRSDQIDSFFRDNRAVFAGLIGLLAIVAYYTFHWDRSGRDPEAGTIIPRFKPPEGFSPAAARYVHKMAYDRKAFSAAVINMAVKGYLEIEEVDKTWKLVRTGGSEELLTNGEKRIASRLFATMDAIHIDNDNHAIMSKAISAFESGLKAEYQQGHFTTNSTIFAAGLGLTLLAIAATSIFAPTGSMIGLYVIIQGVVAAVAAIATIVALNLAHRKTISFNGYTTLLNKIGWGLVIRIGVPFVFFAPQLIFGTLIGRETGIAIPFLGLAYGVANGAFYVLLKAPTQLGRTILDEIEGFRMYLETAEEDRLNVLNPPEKTPELFERFLPFALALDVENEWSEKFTDVLSAATVGGEEYHPRWYHGSRWHHSSPGSFSRDLNSSFAGAIASSTVAPGSSSGSGGGGFSGGGGGGGGGGGW